MESLTEKLKGDLDAAVTLLLKRQKLDKVSVQQLVQLESIVLGRNSIHQLPTGAGKTWASIRF